jgi:soluble lytic murein transglycosylase
VKAYQAMLAGSLQDDEVREARYRLAETLFLSGDNAASVAAWKSFLADYPRDVRVPEASLMLARTYEGQGDCTSALIHYEHYLSKSQVLADLVYEWIGDCHDAGGRTSESLAAYRQALDYASSTTRQVNLREKAAEALLALEEFESALVEYDKILEVAQTDYTRAKAEYLSGQVLAAAAQSEAAHVRYRRAVDNYPSAEYAYYALTELVDAGVEVDEFLRGLVDYYAGELYPDAYGAAVGAFDRYLAGGPTDRVDEALFRKALAQRASDDYYGALLTLRELIRDHPDSQWLARAWLESGDTLAGMDRTKQAISNYQDFAAQYPADDLAPEALWRAAKLREDQGAHQEAAGLFQDVQATFPDSKRAGESLWRAGWARYRNGDTEGANSNWQVLVEDYPRSSHRDRGLYWLGKLGAAPPSGEEGAYWDRLVAEHPQSYYGLRARQIRADESITATRMITGTIDPPTWDVESTGKELLTWLGEWTTVPTDTARIALPGNLPQDLDPERGEALMAIGLRREALDVFDDLFTAARSDPLSLAQVALFFKDQGAHGLAARAALRLAGLWPEGSIDSAPVVLRRLAFPLAYVDLLSSEALSFDVDPLLLAALVRQESLFEPTATSWAGARGLGQVMPATGEGIARRLEMEEFAPEDLYRPSVSMQFAAFYLATQMSVFDDQILVALAAYNGGPGNARRWLETAGGDLDLFVETITLSESQRYLQRVFEGYEVYEQLYRYGDAIQD